MLKISMAEWLHPTEIMEAITYPGIIISQSFDNNKTLYFVAKGHRKCLKQVYFQILIHLNI